MAGPTRSQISLRTQNLCPTKPPPLRGDDAQPSSRVMLHVSSRRFFEMFDTSTFLKIGSEFLQNMVLFVELADPSNVLPFLDHHAEAQRIKALQGAAPTVRENSARWSTTMCMRAFCFG